MSEQKSGMALREFVRDVLFDIIGGVNEAADKVRVAHTSKNLRGAVNPRSSAATSDVEFDVALTVSKTSEAELGVRVPTLNAGGSKERTEQVTSRVKFTVPIAFASQPVGEEHILTAAPAGPKAYTN